MLCGIVIKQLIRSRGSAEDSLNIPRIYTLDVPEWEHTRERLLFGTLFSHNLF